VYLAALGAIHVSLRRAMALSARRARFASAVTHGLRTPLTTLCMYAEMLSAGLVREDQREDYYRTLEREVNRLASLVVNVLEHAGLERGRAVALEPLDLADWLATLGRPCESPANGALRVRDEPRGLERILVNLIDNAGKYGAPPVRIVLSKAANRSELRVSDGGPDVADPRRIFDAYERGQTPSPLATAAVARAAWGWASPSRGTWRGPWAAT